MPPGKNIGRRDEEACNPSCSLLLLLKVLAIEASVSGYAARKEHRSPG